MTEEIKITTEENETKCLCQNKTFRQILTIALGTFIGAFCALSLFAALHKPPMMPPHPVFGPMRGCPAQVMMHKHRHHFNGPRGDRGDFQAQKDFGRKAPFEAQKAPKPEIDD